MNRCEAPNCKMRTYALTEEQLRLVKNNYVISFHKFPEDPDRRRAWINAANKPSWRPPIFNGSLCSLHFRDDCFNENNELYDHAVPSIFFDNFRLHMKEIVEKLDLRYDDDKQNSSLESNQSATMEVEHENGINFVECEEVVIYEDNLNAKLGIENISIPELDQTTALTTHNDALKLPVPVPKLDTSKIDQNNIVDIKIDNSDTSALDPLNIDEMPIEIISSTTANTISSNFLPKNTTGANSLKTLSTNDSPSVTKPPLTTTSAESKVTSSIWNHKPTGVAPKPPQLNKPPSSSVAKSALASPFIPPVSKPKSVQSHSASPILSTVLNPKSSNSQTKSIMSSPQVRKPANAAASSNAAAKSPQVSKPPNAALPAPQLSKSANVAPSVTSNSVAKATSTPSTSVPSKLAKTSNETVTVCSTTREKTISSGMYSILEPATKNLVVQLLNIVKMANTSEANKPKPGQTYSSYLVTSKCNDLDSNDLCEVLPSSAIIENIANYIKMIRKETFVKPKNVSVICGSPAIFLLKNITVEECDPNMNCVYVITTENLLQHLCRMKVKSNPDTSSNQQQPVEKPKMSVVTPNKPLLVADLVSSANPKAIVPIQNRMNSTQAVKPIQNRMNSSPAANNTSKPNTVSRLSNIGTRVPNNSITPVSTAPAKPTTCTTKPTAINSVSCTIESKTPATKSILRSIATKPTTNSSACSTGPKPQQNNSIPSATVAKPAAKSVSSSAELRQLTNNSTLPSTAAKPTAKSVSFQFEPSQPEYDSTPPSTVPKPGSKLTPGKPGPNYSLLYTKNNTALPPPVSKPSSNVLQPPVSRPSSNVHVSYPHSAKLPSNNPVSGSPAPIHKPAPVTSVYSTPTSSIIVNHSNISKTPTYSQASAIASPVMKTAPPVAPVSKTISLITDTPVARVIPTTIGATITLKPLTPNSPAAQLNVQTGSVNFYQTSQSTFYQTTPSQPTASVSLFPVPLSTTPSRTQISTPLAPVVIPSPVVSSIIMPQQPKPAQTPVAKSYSLLNSVQSQPQPSTSFSEPLGYIFQPIQASSFDTNLKTSEFLVTYDSFVVPKQPTPAIPNQSIVTTPLNQSTLTTPLKRKWGEIDDDEDDDDDDDPFFATCDDEDYNRQYLEHQKKEIESCESNILKKEREIVNLKKRIQALKKRLTSVKNPNDTKTDEQLVEEILSKYLDSDGVQFFIGQMKVSGKTYTQFRWSEDDKLFALGLLYRNPAEYNALFQKYTLPSDKTLNKFVSKVKRAEMQDSRSTNGR